MTLYRLESEVQAFTSISFCDEQEKVAPALLAQNETDTGAHRPQCQLSYGTSSGGFLAPRRDRSSIIVSGHAL